MPQQRRDRLVLKLGVVLREHTGQIRVVLFDCPHSVVDRPTQIGALRKIEQIPEANVFGQIQNTLRPVVSRADPPTRGSLGLDDIPRRCKLRVGEPHKDQSKDRRTVLRCLQRRVRPQLVGGVPEPALEFCEVSRHRRPETTGS